MFGECEEVSDLYNKTTERATTREGCRNWVLVVQGLYVALLLASFTVQFVLSAGEQRAVKEKLINNLCEVTSHSLPLCQMDC
jgi:hypothetical protein